MHIVLLGMMASGKTTIGKALSKSLSIPFHDTDKEIEFHEKTRKILLCTSQAIIV